MKTVSIALLAGVIGGAFAHPAAEAATFTEKVVHSFAGGTDGARPFGNVLDVKGTLYGTTINGGKGCHKLGCGTAFSIKLSTGVEAVRYSFGNHGPAPEGGLIDVNGKLYGTTFYGGGKGCGGPGCGTVFSLDMKTGTEKVLYSFCRQQNCADGRYPAAGLTEVGATLYGTTSQGGVNCANEGGCGTVISINPQTGAETVLYSFCGQQNCADGWGPLADMIGINGILYGTTALGGAYNDGTVFSLDPATGEETVLYSFSGGADGQYPAAALTNVNGVLYGTTAYGGGTGCEGSSGCGTVFSLDPGIGTEKVLYSFCSRKNCTDGAEPWAGLIDENGVLYGTTDFGGASGNGGETDCSPNPGCGTVFSFEPGTGAEKVVYSFCSQQNCADGAEPWTGLTNVKGTLYGATELGGTFEFGTVFKLAQH
ncbi:MAG TPA: choice-of-anchor tandem repeat GloVer-containing protein [Rhizomicrobium sp.]|nr:choice-of-anchor tandem repeat GloVer-containing protein [Rhizomicrobium sp.]